MADGKYLSEIFNNIGMMFIGNELGSSLSESPLKKVRIDNYVRNEDGSFTGNIDVSETQLAQYNWLPKSIASKGVIDELNGFTLNASFNLAENFQLNIFHFAATDCSLCLCNKAVDNTATLGYISDVKVSMTGKLGSDSNQYEARVEFYLLHSLEITDVKVAFLSNIKIDCTTILRQLFSNKESMNQMLPWIIDYQELVYPESMQFDVENSVLQKAGLIGTDSSTDKFSSAVFFKVKLEPKQLVAVNNLFDVRDVFLEFKFWNGDSPLLEVSAVESNLSILEVPLSLRMYSPYLWLDTQLFPESKLYIKNILSKLSIQTPKMLESIAVEQLIFWMELKERNYSFTIIADDAPGVCGNAPISYKNGDFSLASVRLQLQSNNDILNAYAEAVMLVPYGQDKYAPFDVQITWDNGATSFVGNIQNLDPPIKDLCVSLFGLSPKSNFPDTTIQYLTIKGSIASGITVDELAGKLHVEMKDTSAIGIAFSFDAEGKFGKDVLSLSGEFKFKSFFKIQAAYAYEQNDYKWSFRFIAGKLSVGVQYDSAKKQLCGEFNSTYTLGDVTDSLLKLLNPSASFNRTGIWSFLNDISLGNSSLVYDYGKEELRITLAPSVNKDFVTIDKLTIRVNKADVEFQIIGDFLGESYTNEKPLTFAPNNPRQVSAKGLYVNYLLFGTGISTPALSGTDVKADMKTLQTSLNSETQISQLKVMPTAGSVFGLDVDIAQTVNVKLIYKEDNSYCAGRFELYGDQAGVLKGLAAELSYTKRNDNIGVFSGKFAPPASLRTIRFGDMEFGLGNLAASIYSNGDYYLDLGYPHNANFAYSFAFKYGRFAGRGGVYLQKNTGTQSNNLPALSKGYYANIMQMGLGMLLNVGDSYSFGPVKADVNLTMTGMFNGTHAWIQEDAKTGREYYRLSAAVIFDGQLQGKVDFGLVGAAVNVGLHATLNMLLETGKSFEADLAFQITANASVKVCFVRIKFHFNLSSSIHITFSNRMTLQRRAKLSLLQAQSSEKVTVHLSVVPVFTMNGSYSAVSLMLFANTTEFDCIVDQLATLLDNGNAMSTDTMELFAADRLTADIDQMIALLSSAFNFVIDGIKINEEKSNDANHSGAANDDVQDEGVLIPLPEWVKLAVRSYYNNGSIDSAERNLSTYETMSNDYLHTVETYYSDMIPDDNALAVNEHGIAAYIFTDFFELVMKAIRAEKESALLNGIQFDAKALTPEQHANIRGVSSRFSLGGRRAPRKSGPDGVEGLMRIAGEQIDFLIFSSIVKFEFEIQKLDTLPEWITFADNKDKFTIGLDVNKVSSYLPIAEFGSDIFASAPECMPYYQEVEEGIINLQKMFTADRFTAFEVPKQLKNEVNYIIPKSEFYWGCTLDTKLQREPDNSGMYRVQIDIVRMEKCISCNKEIHDVVFLYQTDDGYAQWSPSNKASVVCFAELRLSFSGDKTYADLSDAKSWVDVVYHSSETEGGCLWTLPSDCPFGNKDEMEIKTVIRFSQNNKYYDFWDLFYSINNEVSFTSTEKTAVQTLAQGTVCIEADINLQGMSEAQRYLYGLYGGMGAEILDASDTVISTESPSYFAENSDTKDKFKITIPYAKALKKNNIYIGVSEKKQYKFRLFHTDILGNRMDSGKIVSFIPKYHDALMSLTDFPGLSCKGLLVTSTTGTLLKFTIESTIDLSQNSDAKLRYQYGYNQYSRSDVSLILHGSLFSQNQTVDKQKFLTFLSGLINSGTSSNSMELTFSVTIGKGVVGMRDLVCKIVTLRSEDLCENLDKVKFAASDVLIENECSDASAICVEFLLDKEKTIILTGQNKSLLKMSKSYFYGFRPLPVISGSFAKGSTKIQINNLNSRGVFDQYLSDLELLSSPERINAYYAVEELRPYIDRILGLKKKTAEVMAGKVTPLYQYDITDAEKAKMKETAKNFFEKNLFVNRKDIIFAQLQCSLNQPICSKFSLIGTVGGGSGFPSVIDMSEDAPTLNCALDVSEDFYISDLKFKPRYIVIMGSNKRLSISNENSPLFQNILLQGNNDNKKVLPVIQKAPVVPIIASVNSELNSCTVDLRLVMTSNDTVLVKLLAEQTARRLKGNLNSDADILKMEEYRSDSGTYMLSDKTEDRKKIVELMDAYISALGNFNEIPQGMNGGYAFSFECDESGLGKRLKCDKDDASLEISLSEDGYTWRKTTKNGSYYEDSEGVALGQGFYIRIKKTGAGLNHGSFQMKKSKVFVEGETCAVSPEHIMYSTIVSF